VCFILKPDVIPAAKRVFPFDTGAFASGRFDDFRHSNQCLEDYIIDPAPSPGFSVPIPEAPARLVSAFYGNNSGYYQGKPKDSLGIPALDFEVESFFDLIGNNGQTKYDDRRCAIEIQVDTPLPVDKSNVLGLVVPNILVQDTEAQTALSDICPNIISYMSYHSVPAEYTVLVMNIVQQYFSDQGWL